MVIAALLGCDRGGVTLPDESWADLDGAVLQPLGPTALVDWTNLQLRVAEGASGANRLDYRTVEETARRLVDTVYQDVVGQIPVTADTDLAAVMVDGSLERAIRDRIARWEVVEATYTTSGRVDLVAELSIQTLLKPWLMTIARTGSAPPRTSSVVGVWIDARGIALTPTYVVEIGAAPGAPAYRGEMWEEEAVEMPPFAFVPSPADAIARIRQPRADGEAPPDGPILELVAADVVDGRLVLDETSETKRREAADLWGRTTVYVVTGTAYPAGQATGE